MKAEAPPSQEKKLKELQSQVNVVKLRKLRVRA
jgi:hypothetical protein